MKKREKRNGSKLEGYIFIFFLCFVLSPFVWTCASKKSETITFEKIYEFTPQLWVSEIAKCDSAQAEELFRFRNFVESSSLQPGSELIPDQLRRNWMISVWKANPHAPGAVLDDQFVALEQGYETPYSHEQLVSIRNQAREDEDPRVVLKKWINENYEKK